jgi:hypothetical protein
MELTLGGIIEAVHIGGAPEGCRLNGRISPLSVFALESVRLHFTSKSFNALILTRTHI